VDLYPSFNGAENKIGDILSQYADREDLPGEETASLLRTAGRLMTVRDFGKSLFFHVQDGTGRMQGYLRRTGSVPRPSPCLKTGHRGFRGSGRDPVPHQDR